jgi:hypothetical protein
MKIFVDSPMTGGCYSVLADGSVGAALVDGSFTIYGSGPSTNILFDICYKKGSIKQVVISGGGGYLDDAIALADSIAFLEVSTTINHAMSAGCVYTCVPNIVLDNMIPHTICMHGISNISTIPGQIRFWERYSNVLEDTTLDSALYKRYVRALLATYRAQPGKDEKATSMDIQHSWVEVKDLFTKFKTSHDEG